jgi:hypothetical protein
MAIPRAIFGLYILFWADAVLSQQFSESSAFINPANVSSTCLASLDAPVQCDASLLLAIGHQSQYFDQTQLTSLCVSQCRSSLQSYGNSLKTACTTGDIVDDGELNYPATERANFFTFILDSICRKDAYVQAKFDSSFIP